jgi:hypothetical protein
MNDDHLYLFLTNAQKSLVAALLTILSEEESFSSISTELDV